jgi:DNA-binding IclR family transcriptional regulator
MVNIAQIYHDRALYLHKIESSCGAISVSAPTLRMPEKSIRACSEELRRARDIVHRALLGH